MSVNLSPVFGAGAQLFDANGRPLNGGLLNTYAAGTTTPQPTFTTSSGLVQNSNPIVLGADGRTPQEIWLTSGISYKFVLTDSLLNLIGTYDNLIGINDVSFTLSQWVATNLVPTFVSSSQFTVPGDQTLIFTAGRRVQLIVTAGTIVGTVQTSAFTTLTTVTVIFDDTSAIDSGLSVVNYSILTSVGDAIPRDLSDGVQITVASATSTPIGAAPSKNIAVSGTTTITSFDTVNKGIRKWVTFTGALTLTYNASSLILPGARNITTVAGDVGNFVSLGGGNWRCDSYVGGQAILGSTLTELLTVDLGNTGVGFKVQDAAGTADKLRIATAAAGTGPTIDAQNNAEGALAKLTLNGSIVFLNPANGTSVVIGGATDHGYHSVKKAVTSDAGNPIFAVEGVTLQSVLFAGVSAATYNGANTAMFIGKDANTARSINAGGTLNASGADYAEYETKRKDCGIIAKGAIVGFDKDGLLTDQWLLAVTFGVKSTNPSYVGGDMWGNGEVIGMKRHDEGIDLAAFNEKLEAERMRVDRIAYSGKVPCNVTGAKVGDFIIPVQSGDGIAGQAVSNPTIDQLQTTVGQVRKILADGRTEIKVK